MLNLDKYRIVDLSPRLVARMKRLNGDIEEGTADVTGLPWILEEGVAQYDNTLFSWVGGWPSDEVWPRRISGHFGSHTEGGKGHMDHWEGVPDSMIGLWEYPLETFMGPAAVCNFTSLKPVEKKDEKGETAWRGQAITPAHLSNVKKGDIVLMCSPYKGDEMPYLPAETTEWLAKREIKMLAVEMPGVAWELDSQAPQPHNSPTHRNMLGNNIPITYPLVNIHKLKKDRVFYIGLPLNVERLDATWIRAVVLEEI
jgi:kynurenine formamidase